MPQDHNVISLCNRREYRERKQRERRREGEHKKKRRCCCLSITTNKDGLTMVVAKVYHNLFIHFPLKKSPYFVTWENPSIAFLPSLDTEKKQMWEDFLVLPKSPPTKSKLMDSCGWPGCLYRIRRAGFRPRLQRAWINSTRQIFFLWLVN